MAHKDPDVISKTLASELNSCNNWLIENKLSIHYGKCESVLFGSKRKCKMVDNFSITCNGHTITSQSNIKYLGSQIDSNLSGETIATHLIKKANGKMKFLYRYSNFLDKSTRKILCSSLIQSSLDYASMSWYHGLTSKLKQKLQVVQNKMVRYILQADNRTHIGQAELQAVGFLNIKDRVTQLGLNLTHSIFYGTAPCYLLSNFKKISNMHSYRTRASSFNFHVPAVNTITKTTFFYNAIIEWNALPDSIKSITNKATFKQTLRSYLNKRALECEGSQFTQ